MGDVVYDVPISEVAKILDKSDRQIRRYVKERRLKARPVRVDGHVKLMFSREEVLAYKERQERMDSDAEPPREVVVDARLLDRDDNNDGSEEPVSVVDTAQVTTADAVKYVIDALREQIKTLQAENRELHYQLEQRSGQVGFLQGKVEALQDELKMLMPASPSQDEIIERKPWYKRLFGRG